MTSELTLSFLRTHPGPAARVLEQQSAQRVAVLFDELPDSVVAPLLQRLSPPSAAAVLAAMQQQTAAKVLQRGGAHDAALLLRLLTDTKAQALLSHMPTTTALPIQLLLEYPVDTVGAWMNPRPLTLSLEATVSEALAHIRQSSLEPDNWLFLVGDKHRLAGRVTLTQLLRSEGDTRLQTLSPPAVQGIAARTGLLTLKGPRHWQPGACWPVVDRQRRLLGVLDQAGLYHGLNRDIENGSAIDWWGGMEALTETYCAALVKVLESATRTAGSDKNR